MPADPILVVLQYAPRDPAELTDIVVRSGGGEINEHEILVGRCVQRFARMFQVPLPPRDLLGAYSFRLNLDVHRASAVWRMRLDVRIGATAKIRFGVRAAAQELCSHQTLARVPTVALDLVRS